MNNEKLYNTISRSSAWNMAIGVTVIVIGIASGVMLIINSVKLMKQKYQIML